MLHLACELICDQMAKGKGEEQLENLIIEQTIARGETWSNIMPARAFDIEYGSPSLSCNNI